MTAGDQPEGADYELVMPFVTVTSKGGPHEDNAFVAGWTLGALDADMNTLGRYRVDVERWFLPELMPQVELIAMKHGYIVIPGSVVDPTQTYTQIVLTPAPQAAEPA